MPAPRRSRASRRRRRRPEVTGARPAARRRPRHRARTAGRPHARTSSRHADRAEDLVERDRTPGGRSGRSCRQLALPARQDELAALELGVERLPLEVVGDARGRHRRGCEALIGEQLEPSAPRPARVAAAQAAWRAKTGPRPSSSIIPRATSSWYSTATAGVHGVWPSRRSCGGLRDRDRSVASGRSPGGPAALRDGRESPFRALPSSSSGSRRRRRRGPRRPLERHRAETRDAVDEEERVRRNRASHCGQLTDRVRDARWTSRCG